MTEGHIDLSGEVWDWFVRIKAAPPALQDASMTEKIDMQGPIIVFDALCVLCSANAQFVLKHDKKGHFRLASMQGVTGTKLFERFGIDPNDPDTIIVVDGDTVWRNSDAVLEIYAGLGGPWRIFKSLQIIPRFIRDPIYRLIATNRYRIFGKRETCWLPSAEQAMRVL